MTPRAAPMPIPASAPDESLELAEDAIIVVAGLVAKLGLSDRLVDAAAAEVEVLVSSVDDAPFNNVLLNDVLDDTLNEDAVAEDVVADFVTLKKSEVNAGDVAPVANS